MKKLVIFDLDGTLLNTIDDLGNAANASLEKNGFATHSLASYPFYVGNGVRKLMTRVLPEDDRNIETVDQVLKDFKDYYDQHCTDCTKPYAGIPELLEQLTDMDVKIAVASNKYQAAVERIIHHYYGNLQWAAIEGQREGRNTKPDPSVVFGILAKAGVPKAETLYVGDSGVDMETARRACIDSVGVTWGFRPEKELREYHANCIVNSPGELLEIVEHGIRLD